MPCGHREGAVSELGGIDILVNNAAHQASFKSIDGDQRRGMGTDVQGEHPRDVLSYQGRGYLT